jgi:hypothetical protein
MDLHKIFGETLDDLNVRGKDLAAKAGNSSTYISEVKLGKCGIPLSRFGEILEMCEELAPGFKQDFARRISQSNIKTDKLPLADIALMIDSGRLNDAEVAKISSELADVVMAISKRLKVSKREKVAF